MRGLGRLAQGLWPSRATAAPTLRPPRVGDVGISVVVPLYNHARYIDAALRSALTQTAPPCDIVVIDDGSADQGRALAQAALRSSRDCQVLRQDNAGAHAAINRAVTLCRGRYIAVLNSDDLFLPRKLEYAQAIIAADPGVELIAGGVELIDGEGRAVREGGAAEWLRGALDFAAGCGMPQLSLLHENYVATTSNMVFSRRLWESVGGFAPLRYCHDLDFLMQAFDAGRVRLDLARPHVRYRVHAGNTIAEDRALVRAELAAVLAASLAESRARVLEGGAEDGFAAFQRFLRARDLSDLALYLMLLRDRFPSRRAFYAHACAPAQRARYIALLREREPA